MQSRSPTIIADYLTLVRRRWPVLLAGVLAGVALAALFSLVGRGTSDQVATSRILLTAPGKHGIVPPEGEVATFAQLAQSNQVLRPVLRKLHLDESLHTLRDHVSASQAAPSVISISVARSDGDDALPIVRAVTVQMTKAITTVSASVDDRASQVSTTVVDPGSEVASATTPAPVSNLVLGAIVGLGIGFAAVLLLELAAPRVRDARGVSEDFDLGTLGAIQDVPGIGSGGVVVGNSGDDPAAMGSAEARQLAAVGEQFRRLRTNVQTIAFDGRPRSLLVASSVAGEGKTTIATNLAATLALAGEDVVLVDCDLRQPDASARLNLERPPGLTEVLRGEATVEEALTQVDGFSVLPAGEIPPNPSELQVSAQMSAVLAKLGEGDRLVIIDTPAVLTFADAAELAPRCGAVILVARANRTRTRQLEEALLGLRGVRAQVAGVVLNQAPAS